MPRPARGPELAEAIPPALRARAAEECVALTRSIKRGRWEPEDEAAAWVGPGGIGLLVLEGLLVRRVGVDGRFGAELLGEGDLLRPWQGADGDGNPEPDERLQGAGADAAGGAG